MKKMIFVLISIMVLTACTFDSGFTRDTVSGFDKGWVWNHLYLKNDHRTAYCFDDDKFIPIINRAVNEGREVIVSYETYLIRGKLCTVDSIYEKVVVTKVELK